MMIDTHCHVQFKAFEEDRDAVLARCREKQMVLNAVGTQRSTSEKAIALAERYPFVYASVGLHPIQEYKIPVKEELDDFITCGEAFDEEVYNTLAQHPKVIAIGETGLDRYHVPKDQAYDVIFETQKRVFLQHVVVAQKNNLPLVIHVRDAYTEMLQILEQMKEPIRGVIHCFTGNWEQAERYVACGLYLGFTGVITFPKQAESLLDVVRRIPEDRMLVETDSPYLAAQAYRGKRAEPWMVDECIKKIAELRGKNPEYVSEQTSENALRLFDKIKNIAILSPYAF